MQAMWAIGREAQVSKDILPHTRKVVDCECRFESSASAEESIKRATPAFMKYWDKIGTVELWRVVSCTASLVKAQALIVQTA